MVKQETPYLSRSALAEKLGVTLKELTQLLIDSGWLIHENDKHWRLTEKGKFEGGEYRDSKKYGQYIVWPDVVLDHPAIKDLKQATISATTIGKHYGLSARIVNRLFAEMGWLQPFAKGWQLTTLGKNYHGQQHQNSDTGIPYVTWPRTLLSHPYFEQQIAQYQGDVPFVGTDLLSPQTEYRSLNGLFLPSKELLRIANWLYLSGILYAYNRELHFSEDEKMVSDFYLPAAHIHIHFNDINVQPSGLAAQLDRQQLAKKYLLNMVELSVDDIDALDQRLSKALLKWNVTIH